MQQSGRQFFLQGLCAHWACTAVIDQHRAGRDVTDAHIVASRCNGQQPDPIDQRKTVNDSEDVADQHGADAWDPGLACHQPHSCDPFTWCASIHRQLEDGVIQEVDHGGRSHYADEPGGVGRQRLEQTPAAVVDAGAHHEPGDRNNGANQPIDGKRVRSRPRTCDGQRNIDAGDTVYDKVRRPVHHSSAANSSA